MNVLVDFLHASGGRVSVPVPVDGLLDDLTDLSGRFSTYLHDERALTIRTTEDTCTTSGCPPSGTSITMDPRRYREATGPHACWDHPVDLPPQGRTWSLHGRGSTTSSSSWANS